MTDSNQYTRSASNYVHVEPLNKPSNRRTMATVELRVDLGESIHSDTRKRLTEFMGQITDFINDIYDSGIETIDYDIQIDFFNKELEDLASFYPGNWSNIEYKVSTSNNFDGVPCD